MKRLIFVLVMVVVLFTESEINPSYMDKLYVPEYPCVIMQGPGIDYILRSPGGRITAIRYNTKGVSK